MTETATTTLPATQRERVGFSLSRVGVIAANTFTESVRQKVYLVLLLIGLAVLASALFFVQFSFSEQLKFVKDYCLGVLAVFGTLIAIVGTAQMLPAELENRTIYTTLAKPVRRGEFLLGKYLGSVMLLLLTVVIMSLLFGAVLVLKERRLVADTWQEAGRAKTVNTAEVQETVAKIRAEAFDPDLVKGVVLIFVKLALLASITLFFSTFSTSMVFNVVAAFMAFFAGHLRATAAEEWAKHDFVAYLLAIVPDLSAFNVADDIILGNAIPWSHVNEVALYGLVRIVLIVAAAHFIFSKREI